MANGDTKTNQYLDIAAHGERGDFPASCCETRSQTLIREVGERIMDVEDEVEELKNNPDVVDIVATYADLQTYDTQHLTDKDIIRVLQDETHDGESTYYRYNKQSDTWTYVGESKQYTDFVGTDGTTAGEAGLVPAPATTDTGKFLKADGTWDDASGATYTAGDGIDITNDIISATNTGKARVLTIDDYNYPVADPDGIATWLLPAGLYKTAQKVYLNTNTFRQPSGSYSTFIVFEGSDFDVVTAILTPGASVSDGHGSRLTMFATNKSSGQARLKNNGPVLCLEDIIDNLTSTSTTKALSANQGKVLNDKIGGDLSNLTTTDKTSLINAINEVAGQGGGGVTELTTADYNWPTNNPTSVALWLLEDGIYSFDNLAVRYNSNTGYTTTGMAIVNKATVSSSSSAGDGLVLYMPTSDLAKLSRQIRTDGSGGTTSTVGPRIANNLTTVISGFVLDASQGKVLNDKIGGDLSNLTTTDKTSLINAINEVSGAGGGVTELTIADYNYPTDNPDCIALWLLDEGNYFISYDGSNLVDVKMSTGRRDSISSGYYIVSHFTESGSGRRQIEGFYNNSGVNTARLEIVASNGNYLGGVFMNAPGVVQSTGTSTTDVMSQNAVTSMVFADPSTKEQVQIGANASVRGAGGVAIGLNSSTGKALGQIALGATTSISSARLTQAGVMSIQAGNTFQGYNSTVYRLLEGLYDPQSAHDAATKGYVDTAVAGAGGGVTELTTADYNWNSTTGSATEPYDCVALWKLPAGVYVIQDGVKKYSDNSSTSTTGGTIIVGEPTSTNGPVQITFLYGATNGTNFNMRSVNSQTGARYGDVIYMPGISQTTGTGTTDVMSQNAVTSMIFADPATQYKIKIGAGASTSEGSNGVEIGHSSQATGLASVALGYQAVAAKTNSVAIGQGANVGYANSVAIGKDATPTRAGEVNIGSGSSQNGFNNSEYRILGGLYDGQSAHDAATVGQITPLSDTSAPTAATVGRLGQIFIDSTNADAYMCVAVDDVTPAYTWKKISV